MKYIILTLAGLLLLTTVQLLRADQSVDARLPKANNVKLEAYYSEIVVNWDSISLTSGTQWEVWITEEGGQNPADTKVKHIVNNPPVVFEHLKKGVSYKVHIRSKKGDKASETLSKVVKTFPDKHTENERIPHLCTITVDGESPIAIPLHYKGLANTHATFRYVQDGEPIEPKGNVLTLRWNQPPESFYQKSVLEIYIDEGTHGKWKLTYRLTVCKDFTSGHKGRLILGK